MIRKIIWACTLVIFVVGVNAQTKEAQVSFKNPVHDFGKIKEDGGKVSYKFAFVNTGASPVLITDVRPTCGCTAPDWSKAPIPPGGSGYVTAIFNPVGRPGAFTKYLDVKTNNPSGNKRLTIKGEVLPKQRTIADDYRYVMGELRLKSNHLAFGNVMNSSSKDKELEVVNTSGEDMIISFERVPAHMRIRCEPEVLKPNEKGMIVANYDAKKKNDWGMMMDRVNISINGVSERNYRMVISANIVEDFSAWTPEQMANAPVAVVDEAEANFGKMKQGEKFEHTFVLTNDGKSNLHIRKIKASCGCTAVQPEKMLVGPGESIDLKMEFNSAGKRGNQNKSITVTTNDPKRATLILRIKGEVEVPSADAG
jgi:hypothetical protein